MNVLPPPSNGQRLKLLVVTKVSRYDVERRLRPHLTDDQLHDEVTIAKLIATGTVVRIACCYSWRVVAFVCVIC